MRRGPAQAPLLADGLVALEACKTGDPVMGTLLVRALEVAEVPDVSALLLRCARVLRAQRGQIGALEAAGARLRNEVRRLVEVRDAG